jgi:vanillate O-demethylase monooxygenase subunit
VAVPGMTGPVSAQKARSFPIREVWNWVWIWVGDPELAEDAATPDVAMLHAGEPDWAFHEGGRATLAGRYMLLHDNLLDLSHLTYLHKDTVGSPGVAKAKLRVSTTEDGLELARHVIADTLDGTPLGLSMNITGPVDRIINQRFVTPSIHVTMPRFVSSAEGGNAPGHVFGAFCVIHAITPESPSSTHYFWGFTYMIQPDPGYGAKLANPISRAIREDIDASEAIERLLQDGAVIADEIHSPADKAGLMGRQLIQRLIDAEEKIGITV